MLENLKLNGDEKMRNDLSLKDSETLIKPYIIGEFKDTIYHQDGRVEEREWDRNCIVNDIGKLIACLLKGQVGYGGINYWAVGSGSDTWDPSNPPQAQVTDTKCLNEIGRKAIPSSAIAFLDTSGNVTASVTNKLKITLTFGEAECNGVWREFAIFGGNATTTKDSGIAINHKNHEVMVKTNTMTVERQIRFTFINN